MGYEVQINGKKNIGFNIHLSNEHIFSKNMTSRIVIENR
jgi:hypothetical protein